MTPKTQDWTNIKRVKQIKAPLYTLAERMIHVDTGMPFKLFTGREDRDTGKVNWEDRRYLKMFYGEDSRYPKASRKMTMLTARQVEKSTSAAILGLLLMFVYPGYKMLYIQPTGLQANVFSTTRFKKIAESSEFFAKYLVSPGKKTWQVRHRELLNGSEAFFRSCYMTADRIRGISTWGLNLDELQDILPKVIPIIESCQDHAPADRAYRMYTGTPKTKLNIATRLYEMSSMWEWHVLCQHCKHWNYLDERVIGINSYVCTKCDKEIYPHIHSHGRWWAMNKPALADNWGMRISQIMSPTKNHGDLKKAMESPTKSKAQFYNENLGLPSDEGASVLTKAELLKCCSTDKMMTPDEIKKRHGDIQLLGGIDYGSGETERSKAGQLMFKAFSVGIVGGWIGRKLKIFYMEKLMGPRANLGQQPQYFDRLFRLYGCKAVGADWGFGAAANDQLRTIHRWRSHDESEGDGPLLMEFQNITMNSRIEIAYSQKSSHYHGRYIVNRTWLIDTLFNAIRAGRIEFPHMNIMLHKPIEETTVF